MKAYTSGLIIKENTIITKERRLPIKGQVISNLGDEVNYDTIIAQGEIKGHLATFRFASELNINPQDIDKYLLPKIGDNIKQGDIIGKSASFFGLFKSSVKSPYTGVLEYINRKTGTIGIRLASTEIKLNAYIKGKIQKIIPEEGAIIETKGTFIQGIFGIGGEKFGKLLVVNPDTNNTIDNIPNITENTILVYEKGLNLDILKDCEKKGVLGIITGSISDKVLRDYINKELGVAITGDEKVPLTIILTEGFGNIPMSETTFNMLKSIDSSYVSINGATQIRAGVIRPEIIMSKDNKNLSDKYEDATLKIGSKVRIMSEPYLCQYGYISDIFDKPIMLETGNLANCVEINLNNNKVIVPRTNIELIIE
ncbi:MAG: hypothetical protein IJS60_10210 [Abditibacteriota bacterium]|nr:hypothetical protein [Abditibacteriota bacterium]